MEKNEIKRPMVSIVMTSYNRGHYIGQAIDSILSQQCSFPIEIIIGDDCSTDNSRELLADYQAKYPEIIVLNLQETNQGFGRNWASTVKMARGKYVAFLDDDDYYCDDHRLQEMADFMNANEDYGVVHTNYYNFYVDQDVKVAADRQYSDMDGTNLMMAIYSGKEMPCFGTCMIRKTSLDQYVPLDDYIRLYFPIQDWPTEVLLAPHCKFKYIDKPSYVYRQYSGSLSKPKEYKQIIKKYSREKMMYAHISELASIPFDEVDWDRYVSHLLMGLAYQRGDYQRAKEYANAAGGHSVKEYCTRTWLSFELFRLVKCIKNEVKYYYHKLQ